VRPGRAPAALGANLGQPWPASPFLTMPDPGRPFDSWGAAPLLGVQPCGLPSCDAVGSRRRRSVCPHLADCLLLAFELLGCLILAEAVELRRGGVGRLAPLGGPR